MGVMSKLADIMKIGSDNPDDGYDSYEDDEYEEDPEPQDRSIDDFKTPSKFEKKHVEQPVQKRRISMNDGTVRVFKPTAFDQSKEIVDTLLDNNTVLMNFEGVDITISQRVLDIVTGACMAINGNLQKISNYIFIATPSSIEVSGDFQDSLLGGFDVL